MIVKANDIRSELHKKILQLLHENECQGARAEARPIRRLLKYYTSVITVG